MNTLHLVIADDHEVVRKGLRALLEARPGWEVAGEAKDGKEAVQQVRDLKPDVIILDISMPLLNGLEATRQIIKENPKARILILTMHESDPLIQEVLNAGARGYLLKSDAGRDLVTAVDALRNNKTYFTSRVAKMVLDGYLNKKSAPKRRRRRTGTPDRAPARNSAASG